MTSGKRGDAENMNIVFDGHACNLFGSLKQRAEVHVEAQIRESGGDHLGAPVVAILTDLCDQEARPASFGFGEGGYQVTSLPEFRILAAFRGVHARDGVMDGLITAEDFFERQGDFAEGGTLAGGHHGELEEVAVALSRAVGERREGRL